MSDLRRSTVLAGRYELRSPLGRGGMGQVWEAEDRRLGRRVAVKLLSTADTGASQADRLVRRFTREAPVTARLAHPGVPAVYDAGTCDGRPYIVEELVDGRTLGDLVAEQGPLPVGWAAAIAAQIAAVLAVAHDRDVIHRDIKPGNVMVTRDGAAKLLDFGMAGVLEDAGLSRITRSGEALGTPAYMAPEQLRAEPATPRTDLYALGCVLYEMLAGVPVFDAPSPAGLMQMHLERPPAPLPRGDLPPGLRGLIDQTLEKDPGHRPATAAEVYARLLPYVTPPPPLGDLGAGDHPYARVLVRLHDGVPDTPPPTGPRPAPRPARPGPGWALRHSLWMAPTLAFGLLTWLSFAYVAARHHRLAWLYASAAYLLVAALSFTLIGDSPETGPGSLYGTIGLFLGIVVWCTGFIHALWVNLTFRLPHLARATGRTWPPGQVRHFP